MRADGPQIPRGRAGLGTAGPPQAEPGLDGEAQASAATLLAMLETVWQNQGRHAAQGGRAPEPVEQREAEAVLFLAVTLVQWFGRGLVIQP